VRLQIPPGLVWPRSGLAVRHGIDTLAGVIAQTTLSLIGLFRRMEAQLELEPESWRGLSCRRWRGCCLLLPALDEDAEPHRVRSGHLSRFRLKPVPGMGSGPERLDDVSPRTCSPGHRP
jgi:hypothetical protein